VEYPIKPKSKNLTLCNKELKLITPHDFQKMFAPSVGIAPIRELFRREDFPATKIGNKYYTTGKGAKAWLSTMGKDL
jgi:hypothetical protein